MTSFIGRSIDRCILLFVKECFTIFNRPILRDLGIENFLVLPGNQNAQRAQEPYATVLSVYDEVTGQPFFYQLRDGSVVQTVPRMAMYSVHFYRTGAFWLAKQFDSWCMSEDGLMYASHAFSDGRIEKIVVLDGGNGIAEDDIITIEGDGSDAEATPTIVRGAVAGVEVTNFGNSYSVPPRVRIGNAALSARGAGFVIEFPLSVRRLDAIVSDMFEERAQIDLKLRYNLTERRSTGYIDDYRGAICLDDQEEIIDAGA